MAPLPTRRLLDATARLAPADRALLNLWLNRGLDDERLSKLTGMRPEAVVTRRARLIERLSEELALPPDDVQAALARIAGGLAEPASTAPAPIVEPETPSTNGHGEIKRPDALAGLLLGPAGVLTVRPQAPEIPGLMPGLMLGPGAAASLEAPGPQPAGLLLGPSARQPNGAAAEPLAAEPQAAEPLAAEPGRVEPGGAEPGGRSRRRALGVTGALVVAAVVVVAVVVVVLIVAGAGSGRHQATAHTISVAPKATPTPTPSPTPAPPTGSSPAPAAPTAAGTGPGATGFAGLPGGPTNVRGSVQLVGSLKRLKLKLRVTHLPAPHRGHYEVWLFNSVLDSTPVGRVREGVGTATYRLPHHARRYRWIDVSFQPLGYVNHSGESVVRATNPAHTTKARLRKRSAHRRHQLRRATSGSKKARTSK